MRIELLTSYVSLDVEAHEGDTIDLPAHVAEELVERGSAVKAKPVKAPAAAAAKPAAKGRRKATNEKRETRG